MLLQTLATATRLASLFLIEQADTIAWHLKYLIKMKQCRADGKEIFYLDKSWIDTNLTFQKCWQKKDNLKGIITGSALKRLIILHIGL
jgi:hypothetical protein